MTRWAGAAIAAFALCAAAHAETPAATLAGVVVDAAASTPVAEAIVTVRGPALIGEQAALTDADGAFEITLLPPGTYSLSVEKDGFQPFVHSGLAVKAGTMRVRVAVLRGAPPPAVAAVKEAAVEFNDTMTAPSMISGPAPEYTPDAIDRGIEGTMQVRCVVSAQGTVRGCRVVKGLPFMNAAVIDALERRRYKPALANGKPVDVFYTFNIRLKLPGR